MDFFFVIVGVLFIGGGLLYFLLSNNKVDNQIEPGREGISFMAEEEDMQNWNEEKISLDLIKLQNNPPILRHFVDSIKKRFIDNQNTKTAHSRLSFLDEQIKYLELANKYKDLESDLKLKIQEHENKSLKGSLDNQTARLSFKDEDSELEIKQSENERRKLEEILKIAKLKKEIDEVTNPTPPIRKPTREEINAEKKNEIQTKILAFNQEIDRLKKDTSLEEDEQRRQINMLQNKLMSLNEKLYDLL